MIYPPNQKPPIWSIDPGIVAYNCQNAGIPHPVLAMPMWEGAGNRVLDYSGHGNHGALTNNSRWAGTTKGVGTEFPTDNGTDRINLGSITSADLLSGVPTGEISVVSKVYMPAPGTLDNDYPRIFDKSSSGGADAGWGMWFNNVTSRFGAKVDMAVVDLNSASTYTSAGWYDLACVFKSGNSNLYVNGNNEASSASMFSFSGITTSAAIGNWNHAADRQWNGYISYVYVWGTFLTASQIKFIYNNPYFMFRLPEELYGYAAAAAGVTIPVFLHHYNQMRQ